MLPFTRVFKEASREKMEGNQMATNGIDGVSSSTQAATVSLRRYSRLLSGIAIRLLIALIISCIILAFFVTGVASH